MALGCLAACAPPSPRDRKKKETRPRRRFFFLRLPPLEAEQADLVVGLCFELLRLGDRQVIPYSAPRSAISRDDGSTRSWSTHRQSASTRRTLRAMAGSVPGRPRATNSASEMGGNRRSNEARRLRSQA